MSSAVDIFANKSATRVRWAACEKISTAGNIAGNTPTSPETGNIAGNIAGDVAGDIGGNIIVAAMSPQCRRSVAGNVAGNFFCRTGVAPAIF